MSDTVAVPIVDGLDLRLFSIVATKKKEAVSICVVAPVLLFSSFSFVVVVVVDICRRRCNAAVLDDRCFCYCCLMP